MIEQVMIFVLGVCVAGLLALLCLPAISRRAIRLAQVAVARQMPISVDEIVAQRDLLRAEFATERRRLEQALEHARAAQASEMSDAGRRTADLARLKADLSAETTARKKVETALAAADRLGNEVSLENAALQKALFDAEGMESSLRETLATLSRAHADLRQQDTEKAEAIATLQEERDRMSEERNELERTLMQAKLDVSIDRARAEALAAQIDNHEQAGRTALATEADLRRKITDYEQAAVSSAQNGAPHDPDLDMLRRTIVEIGREVVRLADQRTLPTVEASEPLRSAAMN